MTIHDPIGAFKNAVSRTFANAVRREPFHFPTTNTSLPWRFVALSLLFLGVMSITQTNGVSGNRNARSERALPTTARTGAGVTKPHPTRPAQNATVLTIVGESVRAVRPGQSTTYELAIEKPTGVDSIGLAVVGLPSRVGACFSESTPSGTSVVLSVSPTASAALGTFPFQVVALAGGSTIGSVSATLVVSQGTVSILVVPSSRSIRPGEAATFAIALERTDFTGPVALTADGLPEGASAEFSEQAFREPTASVRISTTSSVRPGTYAVRISGTAEGATVNAANLDLVVLSGQQQPSLALTLSPAAVEVAAGERAVYRVTLSGRGDFAGPVTPVAGNLPAGVTATFSPATLTATTGDTVTLTLQTGQATPAGSFPFTVSGQGATVSSTAGILTVRPATPSGSVAVQVNPAAITLARGQAREFLVTLQRQNFSGRVDLTASGLPTGMTATFGESALIGGSNTSLTIATTSATPGGTYSIVVGGSAPSASVSPAVLQVTVTAPPSVTLTVTPSIQFANPGDRSLVTITATSSNFTGNLPFRVSNLTPSDFAMQVPGTFQLTVTFSPNQQVGTYQFTLTSRTPEVEVTPVTFSIVVGLPTSGPNIALASGVSDKGQIAAPQTAPGVLNRDQYFIRVPAGASRLTIELEGAAANVDLYARFGERVTIVNTRAVADARSESSSFREVIVITPQGTPRLREGVYFIAVGNFGPGATTFTIKATVDFFQAVAADVEPTRHAASPGGVHSAEPRPILDGRLDVRVEPTVVARATVDNGGIAPVAAPGPDLLLEALPTSSKGNRPGKAFSTSPPYVEPERNARYTLSGDSICRID